MASTFPNISKMSAYEKMIAALTLVHHTYVVPARDNLDISTADEALAYYALSAPAYDPPQTMSPRGRGRQYNIASIPTFFELIDPYCVNYQDDPRRTLNPLQIWNFWTLDKLEPRQKLLIGTPRWDAEVCSEITMHRYTLFGYAPKPEVVRRAITWACVTSPYGEDAKDLRNLGMAMSGIFIQHNRHVAGGASSVDAVKLPPPLPFPDLAAFRSRTSIYALSMSQFNDVTRRVIRIQERVFNAQNELEQAAADDNDDDVAALAHERDELHRVLNETMDESIEQARYINALSKAVSSTCYRFLGVTFALNDKEPKEVTETWVSSSKKPGAAAAAGGAAAAAGGAAGGAAAE